MFTINRFIFDKFLVGVGDGIHGEDGDGGRGVGHHGVVPAEKTIIYHATLRGLLVILSSLLENKCFPLVIDV